MAGPTQFTTVITEGGLLPSDLISRLVNDTESLPGTRAEDYRLTPGRQLREIINRSWNDLLGAWQVFQPQIARLPPEDHTANLTWDRWLLPLFAELGYGRLERLPEAITIGDKDYPISHHHEQAFIHLVGWNVRLDRRTAGVVGAARAAPHSMVQELLNRSDEHLWAIVSNGRQLRLLRDNSSLTRAAYVEFDLEQMFSEGIFTDFVALWLLVHASRCEGDPQNDCWLETWATSARQQGVRALDTLGEGFEQAIKTLGQGFLAHPTNTALREGLRDGTLSGQDYYRELLRVVYRIVFLLVAEDRGLLHPPDASTEVKERYVRYFSLSRIRDLARRRRGTKHSDLWEQVAIVSGALGSEGQPALGLPALNSGLWSAEGTADLGSARLANTHLLEAVRWLAYTRQEQALHRIDYRNLGSEELGSVYESLLELQPELDPTTAAFSLGHAAGNERKTSGSYYTPTSLISSLLDSALEPVLDNAVSKPDPEAALLELRVLDPACGSGHFLVAAAQRIARRLAMLRTGETDPAPDVFRHALREVIGRGMFGIDLNPMAVELCRVSLWLESVEPGKPLSFLDHHVVCGNSLLGVTPEQVAAGIPDDAYKPLSGDERAVVSAQRRRNATERGGQGAFSLWESSVTEEELAKSMADVDQLQDDDLEGVETKQARWQSVVDSEGMRRAKFAADAWCAAFVVPKDGSTAEITTSNVRQALEHGLDSLDPRVVEAVARLADEYRFLHLHTAFPQVFSSGTEGGTESEGTSDQNGFDAVLGNPPWEKVKLAEKEFFATRAPEIADAAGARRKRIIAALVESDPELYAEYRRALHHAEAESIFLHTSGGYPLTGRGDVNTYAVFAELMRTAAKATGRCGMIAPTGIATDDTTKHFFSDLVAKRSLVSLYDFENREGIFPAIHSATKFCLLTMTGRVGPTSEGAEFAFFCQRTEDLRDDGRRFTLTPEELALVNPNTRTCPIFRSRRDAELTLGIYRRVPVLIAEGPPEVNFWGIKLATMFHMTNDSGLFRSATECEQLGAHLDGNVYRHPDARVWLPLYEGKMVGAFDHRAADVVISPTATIRTAQPRYLDSDDHRDASRLPIPRAWVDSADVDGRLHGRASESLLTYCRFTSPTNERSMIVSLIPRVAVGDNLFLILCDSSAQRAASVLALLSSFVLDYVARQKVGGTNLNFFIVEQLPVLSPESFDQPLPWTPDQSAAEWVISRVLELTYTAIDLTSFAKELGYDGPPFTWNDERRLLLRAELDACFFHLYGIERDDIEYIMGTFPIVKRRDESTYGEYRTARLILERYDEMSKAAESGVPYRGVLE
jgi:hypothetical protein